MLPLPYRVASRRVETHDSVTLVLEPVREALPRGLPGQFTMLYQHGIGEVAISVSGDPASPGPELVHTVRDVGAVSRALHDARTGDVIGARGPFGTSWSLDTAAGHDLVIVAGGVGLAPLRPVVLGALAQLESYGRVTLVAGARSPAELLFREELAWWAEVPGLDVEVTVDRAEPGWEGPVGFVTEPLARLELDPARTIAFVCGPEPMMRFSASTLLHKGMPARDIKISLERDMKCGVGLCGHCQLGPLLVCRDGPVVDYERAGPLLAVKEL
jgi:NAD(P)H-flavin reductase